MATQKKDFKKLFERKSKNFYAILFFTFVTLFSIIYFVSTGPKFYYGDGENGINSSEFLVDNGIDDVDSNDDYFRENGIRFVFLVIGIFSLFALAILHHQRLDIISRLEVGARNVKIIGSPKTSLNNFFEILDLYMSKHKINKKIFVLSAKKINDENSFKGIIAEKDNIYPDTKYSFEWDQVNNIISTYLEELRIEIDKFTEIASYEGKDSLVEAIRALKKLSNNVEDND